MHPTNELIIQRVVLTMGMFNAIYRQYSVFFFGFIIYYIVTVGQQFEHAKLSQCKPSQKKGRTNYN